MHTSRLADDMFVSILTLGYAMCIICGQDRDKLKLKLVSVEAYCPIIVSCVALIANYSR